MNRPARPGTTRLGGSWTDAGTALLWRRATVVAAILAPVCAIAIGAIALLAGEARLLAWTAVGGFAALTAAAQLAVHREDPAVLMLLIAAAVAAGAGVAPASSIPGVVAAVAMLAIVVITVVETGRRALAIALAILTLLGVALLRGPVDAGRVAGLVGLVAAGGGSWAVLDRLVDTMRAGDTGYRSLFDRVPVGLYRTGLRGELLEINPAFAELLGEPRDALIGRLAREFFVDPEDFGRLRETIGDRPNPVTTDIRFRRVDGEIIWVRDVTRPVTDAQGCIVWFEGEIQDVTEQRRHLAELETLIRSKSELVGAISHELRTPLTAVVGFLEILIEPGHSSAEDAELLEIAHTQARDVAAIVEDLLTAARLDNRELVIQAEVVDLRVAITAALTSVDNGAGDGVRLGVPPGITVVADASRIRQVLRNLIVNAQRYGVPPIAVDVVVGDGVVEIVVSDHGPEITEEVATRMWEPFFSGGEGESARPGSIGLGLAVSRRLVTLMGGDLTHRRRAGKTEFVLALRRASVPSRAA